MVDISGKWDKEEKKGGLGITIESIIIGVPEVLVVYHDGEGKICDVTTELLGSAKTSAIYGDDSTYVKGGIERCEQCSCSFDIETSVALENLGEGEEMDVECEACGSIASFYRKHKPLQPEKLMSFLKKYLE